MIKNHEFDLNNQLLVFSTDKPLYILSNRDPADCGSVGGELIIYRKCYSLD